MTFTKPSPITLSHGSPELISLQSQTVSTPLTRTHTHTPHAYAPGKLAGNDAIGVGAGGLTQVVGATGQGGVGRGHADVEGVGIEELPAVGLRPVAHEDVTILHGAIVRVETHTDPSAGTALHREPAQCVCVCVCGGACACAVYK